jgi:ABC-type multidrug transport system fused ATPase/permease subunit
VGSSGAGKSTITKLLLRFFDPWEGRVLIDGQDVRRFQLKSLRKQISLVPQDPILFRRTLAENISYGNSDSTFEDIVAAAKAAQAHDFIASLPDRYDTVLGERGDRISGGQRQRIALARAILRQGRILLLDEPTTGIDAITEAQLNETLRRHLDSKTVFIIAHRCSTVRAADLILVIDDGKAAEQGKHSELLVSSPLYRRLSAFGEAVAPVTNSSVSAT